VARAAVDPLGQEDAQRLRRHPSLPAVAREEPVTEAATAEPETLAPQLAAVTRMGLEKIAQISALPTDPGNGNILRAQTHAAGLAVNAQLRADEAKLKQVRSRDIMERLLALVAEERKRWLSGLRRPLAPKS
jgi:hypothetical protein